MYGVEEGGYIGALFDVWSADDTAISGEEPDFSGGYASGSDWYFQMVFCATTASIVSGTVAERLKLWPFLIFTLFLTGFIYPIVGGWEWGTGWLDAMGFRPRGSLAKMEESFKPYWGGLRHKYVDHVGRYK